MLLRGADVGKVVDSRNLFKSAKYFLAAIFISFLLVCLFGCESVRAVRTAVVTDPQYFAKETNVTFDPYDNCYRIVGPLLIQKGDSRTQVWLKGSFDKFGANEILWMHVFFRNKTWFFLDSAKDIGGTQLTVNQLRRQVEHGDIVEEVAVNFSRDFLEARKMPGLDIRVSGSKGYSIIVKVPSAYVIGFLERYNSAVEEVRAGKDPLKKE
jgi:hypothetical protein